MSFETTVLLITSDDSLAAEVRARVESLPGGVLLRVTEAVEPACLTAVAESVGLILVHLEGKNSLVEVARVLWLCSLSRRPASVIALGNEYRLEDALPLFQLGVADYLSCRDHLDQLSLLIGSLGHRVVGSDAIAAGPLPTTGAEFSTSVSPVS